VNLCALATAQKREFQIGKSIHLSAWKITIGSAGNLTLYISCFS